MNDVGILSTAG